MSAPTPSKLDYEQCIQGSYDEVNGRLRVETELATVNIGGQQEILITDDVDAIKIGNGSHQYLAINPDGSINTSTTITGITIPSIGINGDVAPTSSTQIGGVDQNGDLQPIHIDSNGRIEVNAGQIFGIQDLKILFNEVSSISVGSETLVNTYTAPSGKISYLLSILGSGGNRAQYNIYNNALLFDKQYAPVTQLSVNFDYKTNSSSVPGMVIPIGNTIQMKVINNGSDITDYNSRFMILEVT